MDQDVRKDRQPDEALRAEAERSLSDPAELFRIMNSGLRRGRQQPISQQRIQELTDPAARAERREKRERAAAVVKVLEDVRKREGDWAPGELLGNLHRVVPAFLEPLEREGAKERNDAFLKSLETPEGVRELAMRAVALAEKVDESIFLERDPEKVFQIVTEKPELIILGFVFKEIGSYLSDQPDLDPRLGEAMKDRKTLWECAGGLSSIAQMLGDPLHEFMGGMNAAEIEQLVLGFSAGTSPLQVEQASRIVEYSKVSFNVLQDPVSPEEQRAAKLLSEKNLLVGDLTFHDASGKRLTHTAGLQEIGKGNPVTLDWYPSVTSGEGMTCTVSVRNDQLEMSEGKRCTRREITDVSYNKRLAENAVVLEHLRAGSAVDPTGAPLTEAEATQRLLEHREVLAVWKNGTAIRIFNTAESSDPAEMTLAETQSTVQKEAERLLSDRDGTIQLVQNLLLHNGQAQIAPERVQEIRADTERTRLHEAAKETLRRSREKRAYLEKYPVPEAAGHLTRLAQEFLEPDETPEAAERNRAFMASLETPQGRRDLFLRGLDALEEGPGAFLETDIQKAIRDYPEQEKLLNIGWAMQSTLLNYANSDEAADLDPEIVQRLQERKSICEECSEIQDELRLAADDVYPALGGLSMEENIRLMSATGTRNPLEQEAFRRISGQMSNLMGEKERWQTRQEPERKAVLEAGQRLAEKGLLKGDNVFRSESGERLAHMDALKRLVAGEKLTLEHYDSRSAGDGTVYTVAAKDGTVTADAERSCTREPSEVPAYDPVQAAVGRAMKQVKDFAAFQTKAGEALSWNEGLRQLAQGTEIVVAGKDGALRKLSAEVRGDEKGAAVSLKEAPTTRLELDTENVVADHGKLLDMLSEAMRRNGIEPISAERKAELLNYGARTAQHETAVEAQKVSDAQDRMVQSVQLPRELMTMQRVARLFLKTPDQPNAAEDNLAFAESLKTPEGRRELFYRTLDRLEQYGEAAFVETDPDRMVEIARQDPVLGKMGFVVLSMANYAKSDEGMDLPQETLDRLEECKTLCEEGGSYASMTALRADDLYPVLGGMNSHELQNLFALFSAPNQTRLEDSVFRTISAYAAKGIDAAMNAENPREDLHIGAELGARGLLKGDVTFRNEAGERMKHLDALQALRDGQTVTLEAYENRKAESGTICRCTRAGGELTVSETMECRRKLTPDKAFSRSDYAVGKALRNITYNHDCTLRNAAGEVLDNRAAQVVLKAGQTITSEWYSAGDEYLGKRETLRLENDRQAEGGVKLAAGKPSIITRTTNLGAARSTVKDHVQELEKIQQVLKQSDPFYVMNSSQFGPMMTALDNVVKFHRHRQGFDAGTRQQMTELYRNLNEAVNAYLAVKTEKLRERTDDQRGQLRFNVVSSLKTLLGDRSVARLGDQLTRQAAQARQQAAPEAPQANRPQRNRQGGPQL